MGNKKRPVKQINVFTAISHILAIPPKNPLYSAAVSKLEKMLISLRNAITNSGGHDTLKTNNWSNQIVMLGEG